MNFFTKQIEDNLSNTVRRVTLMDRIKRAIKAFHGSSVGTLHMGVEVHRCDQCEEKNQKKNMVFYICDRKACNPCDNPDCKHTPKIEHAVHFKSNAELGIDNGYSDYWEESK